MRYFRATVLILVGVLSNPHNQTLAQHKDWSEARESITTAKLKRHVDVLAGDSFEGREAGSRGGHAAGGYIVKSFSGLKFIGKGDEKSYFQSFGSSYRNILALLPGSDRKLREEVILVGAHYDHVGYGTRYNSYGPTGYIHNGADDNASGTAALIEIARAFDSLQKPPKRSVLFVFWDAEEKGLLGSKHFVASPTIPLSQIRFAFNVDMVGRIRKNNLTVFGTRTNRGLRRLTSEANHAEAKLQLNFAWHLQSNSDHYNFFRHEIPILMLHSGLHSDYHRPSDDAHLVNSKDMQRASRLLGRLVHEIANSSTPTKFRTRSTRESAYAKELFETPLEDLPPRLGIWWDPPKKHKGKLMIVAVRSGSPAEYADLRIGDEVVKVDGKPFQGEDRFQLQILAAKKTIHLSIRRDGEAELIEKPIPLSREPVRVGVAWRFDASEPGVAFISRVVNGSAAAQCGLRVGDRIYRVNGKRFKDGNELFQRFVALPGPFRLTVERDGRLRDLLMKVLPQ